MRDLRGRYRTIKALVLDHVHRMKGVVDYDVLTREVLQHFPSSRWKRTHWGWYRSQIRSGRFRNEFSDEERRNLGFRAENTSPKPPPSHGVPPRASRAKVPEVKRLGDRILEHTRFVISLASKDDPNLRFKLNRWVFARLMQEEIRAKRPVKKALWENGMRACQACGQRFATAKGTELHRKNPAIGYSVENCELLCRDCHQELGSGKD